MPSEKTALPTGTQIARLRPVSTPSWRVSRAQPTEDAVKKIPAETVPRGAYEGPHRSRVSRKTPQATATTTVLNRYRRTTSGPVAQPARGTYRTTAPDSVVAVIEASIRCAAMAAEPCPTASSE